MLSVKKFYPKTYIIHRRPQQCSPVAVEEVDPSLPLATKLETSIEDLFIFLLVGFDFQHKAPVFLNPNQQNQWRTLI